MTDQVKILIENLKETFKAIEKVLLPGLTAGLLLLVLAITNRELIGQQNVMFADINAPATFVAMIALGTYFATGAIAALYFSSRRKIVKKLFLLSPELVEATLTYPSVASKMGVPQILALFLVGAIGMLAIYLFYAPTHEMKKVMMTFTVIGSPYIALVAMALWTALEDRIREKRHQRELSQ